MSTITSEDLLQKHRKERKDLQAKIQSIKKTADKKKKKETAEKIAQLEADLKAQQQIELDQLKDLTIDNNTNKECSEKEVEEVPQQCEKISKAQRRRNKKTQHELENQRRIAEQEIENEAGPRNVESLAIKKILDSKGLQLHTIPSDGDCLYQAVNHQLEINGLSTPGVASLRRDTAKYMREHKNDMIPFMITEDGDIMSDIGFDDYCNRIETTKAWGGQLELTALSEILKCQIHILQATGPPTILGDQFTKSTPLVLTYHRHMYGLGEHYNSTKAAVVEEAQDDF
ncbi:deubiquitinase OTUD6B [Chrysoperla carnea]|uniref:deubiquitinase OTUD6B n=1 Tax=Chrysoperla carnea TaxID=189513 RepID=UPI001D094BDF|nr:deubiquitinase OTUD6B [Chrysoperla carnea]